MDMVISCEVSEDIPSAWLAAQCSIANTVAAFENKEIVLGIEDAEAVIRRLMTCLTLPLLFRDDDASGNEVFNHLCIAARHRRL